MSENLLLRMQDASGRGPYKPGFSHQWVDQIRNFSLPPLQEDFGPKLGDLVGEAHSAGMHVGTAARRLRFEQWFTPTERIKLAMLGYHIVDASECVVLGETQYQALIASSRPLSELPVCGVKALMGSAA